MKLRTTVIDESSIRYFYNNDVYIKVTKINGFYNWELNKLHGGLIAFDDETPFKTANAAKLSALRWVKKYL